MSRHKTEIEQDNQALKLKDEEVRRQLERKRKGEEEEEKR